MNGSEESKETQNRDGNTPDGVLISKTISDFLEYIRVEDQRPRGTLETYRHLLERWVIEMGDGPVTGITAEQVWVFKRKLTDGGLGPATIGGAVSVLRSFLRYLREVRGMAALDGD